MEILNNFDSEHDLNLSLVTFLERKSLETDYFEQIINTFIEKKILYDDFDYITDMILKYFGYLSASGLNFNDGFVYNYINYIKVFGRNFNDGIFYCYVDKNNIKEIENIIYLYGNSIKFKFYLCDNTDERFVIRKYSLLIFLQSFIEYTEIEEIFLNMEPFIKQIIRFSDFSPYYEFYFNNNKFIKHCLINYHNDIINRSSKNCFHGEYNTNNINFLIRNSIANNIRIDNIIDNIECTNDLELLYLIREYCAKFNYFYDFKKFLFSNQSSCVRLDVLKNNDLSSITEEDLLKFQPDDYFYNMVKEEFIKQKRRLQKMKRVNRI